ALENSLTVAYANHSGIEDDFLFAGSSVIADPAGEIVARAGTASEIIYGEVRPAEPEVDYLRDRRADLYPLWDVSVPSKETP
ncbi:MAG TPA: nitrilase, partial [Microbacteriaceae bacterium]|nr:nitrilase [Microbacteriaceae bacterium]